MENTSSSRMQSSGTWMQDPLANTVDWSPLVGGGTNFRTHKLSWAGPEKALFTATRGYQIFSYLFLGIGLIAWIAAFLMPASAGFFNERWLVILFSLPFAGVRIYLLRSANRYVAFDFAAGDFVQTKRPKGQWFVAKQDAFYERVPLGDIYAFQLLSEPLSDYSSYEFNLILRDGSRIHVVDHGDRKSLLQDMETLAARLDCGIWVR
ncbi:MAG: hypothetical protein KDC44_09190 [Phaeodactylibacter sp.]|nr:hypothetical protein [Phaeodactylibacter sp.]